MPFSYNVFHELNNLHFSTNFDNHLLYVFTLPLQSFESAINRNIQSNTFMAGTWNTPYDSIQVTHLGKVVRLIIY